MEIIILEIILILCIHWVCDFLLQSEEWATTKSHNIKSLLKHTSMYSWPWAVFFGLLGVKAIYFSIITFVAHTITDYFTSKLVSRKFKNNQLGSKIPNWGAFSIIGLDQLLHYIQLLCTYYFLKNL